MTRRARIALGTILIALSSIAAPAAAFADTEGSIVVTVDVAPRNEAASGDLARAGADPALGFLLAGLLALGGVTAVHVARRRGATS